MSVHVLIAIFQVWHLLCNPCLFHVTRCVDKVVTLNVLSDEMSRQNKKTVLTNNVKSLHTEQMYAHRSNGVQIYGTNGKKITQDRNGSKVGQKVC